jgi:hypothetical protein
MSNKALTGFFLGQMAAGGLPPVEMDTGAARNAAMAAAAGGYVAAQIAREETQGWRQYAARLRVNLDGRKLSEATLLAELKKANINHPLATEEGFAEIFKKNLIEQYGILDGDDVKYGAMLDEEQKQSAVGGRDAVG